MKFKFNDKHVTFNMCQSIRQPKDMWVESMIDTIDKVALITPIKKRLC